jgi:hypothetical protein
MKLLMKLFEPAKKEWRRRSKPIFILVLLLLVGAFVLLLINPVNLLILYLVSASFIIRSIEQFFMKDAASKYILGFSIGLLFLIMALSYSSNG